MKGILSFLQKSSWGGLDCKKCGKLLYFFENFKSSYIFLKISQKVLYLFETRETVIRAYLKLLSFFSLSSCLQKMKRLLTMEPPLATTTAATKFCWGEERSICSQVYGTHPSPSSLSLSFSFGLGKSGSSRRFWGFVICFGCVEVSVGLGFWGLLGFLGFGAFLGLGLRKSCWGRGFLRWVWGVIWGFGVLAGAGWWGWGL